MLLDSRLELKNGNASELWQKYKYLIAILVVLSIGTAIAVWFLNLFPQYVPQFVLTLLIPIFFLIILLVSKRKYRIQLSELLMSYRINVEKRGGLVSRYGEILYVISIVILSLVSILIILNPELLGVTYVLYLVLSLFIVFLVSFVIFIFGLLKTTGKWGLLIILIIAVITILRFLLRQ